MKGRKKKQNENNTLIEYLPPKKKREKVRERRLKNLRCRGFAFV